MTDVEKLISAGYARTSNAFGLVSRIDRPDWREYMAAWHVKGFPNQDEAIKRGREWVRILGGRSAADLYRRCISKDTLELGRSKGRKFPSSCDGPTEFMELK